MYKRQALETIAALKEKFKAEYIVDVMIGRATADVRSYRHEESEVFGCAEGSDPKYLQSVIRQGVIEGYIERGIENYGILKLTAKGKRFLDHPVSFKIVEDNDFNEDAPDEESMMKSGSSCAADPELFAILSALRRKIAAGLKLPPYVIFQDPSLEAMATTYPINSDELANIVGVGAVSYTHLTLPTIPLV